MAKLFPHAPVIRPTGSAWVVGKRTGGTHSVWDQVFPRKYAGVGSRKSQGYTGLAGRGVGLPNGSRDMMRAISAAWKNGGGYEQGDPGFGFNSVSRMTWGTFAATHYWPGVNGLSVRLDGPGFFFAANACAQQVGESVSSGPEYFPIFFPIATIADPGVWAPAPAVTGVVAYAGTSDHSWYLQVSPWLLIDPPVLPPPQYSMSPALMVSFSSAFSYGTFFYPRVDRASGFNVFRDTNPGAPPNSAEFPLPLGMGPRVSSGPIRVFLTVRYVAPINPWDSASTAYIGPGCAGHAWRGMMILP